MVKMVETRTIKGTLIYNDDYEPGHLNLLGVVDWNGEEVNVNLNLTDMLRDYENTIVEITVKVIEQ